MGTMITSSCDDVSRNCAFHNYLNAFSIQKQSIQCELEKAQLMQRQLRESVSQHEELLQDTKEQLEAQVNRMNETCSDELAGLHTDINQLQTEKVGST